ncbi:neuraminidase-like domain-containing protein [Paraburkholderia unamae]|uniref:Neuraminidase-like domain-containing protein n=1 Tax=Paraburkholderia unamae TaxID=219649 RepID=A0ACC6RRR1_9BURK
MFTGMTNNAQGNDVSRLHRVLIAAGFGIERTELERQRFGDTTAAAVRSFQRRCSLPETGILDETTIIELVRVEQTLVININESRSTETPSGPPPNEGWVKGKLVDCDGTPIPRTKISLFSVLVRRESSLHDSTTDDAGHYRFCYKRTKPLSLLVRAYDKDNFVIAASQPAFQAGNDIEIDLTTAADGVVRTLSQYAALLASVNAALWGISLFDLKENKESHELTFLAKEIGVTFNQVAYLYLAQALAKQNDLRPETFFGLFAQRTPPNLSSALGKLPDAGIDTGFETQVFNAVLNVAPTTLAKTLSSAVTANILPASYATLEAAQLARLDALRVTAVGAAAYLRGKTPLNDLLAAGTVSADVQTAFVQAYAQSSGNLGSTWKTLRANKNLSKAQLTALKTVLSAGELLTGNLPLVEDTLQRLTQGSLASLRDLARLDESDWEARIRSVDPNGASIPQVLPGDTPDARIARFAKALAQRFAGRYPTTAFVGALTKTGQTSFRTKTELVGFLNANPTFNFRRSNVDQFVTTNKVTIVPTALAELKTAQRLFRVSPHYTTVEALHSAGYTSAQSVYFAGRSNFIAQMTGAMGSAPKASMAYARAQMTYAAALAAFGKYTLQTGGLQLAGMSTPQPDPQKLATLPDLQALFGPLDYFQCDDCQSVYSPAAYLVDLLQYLTWFGATPLPGSPAPISGIATARDALLLRRPDIEYVALNCDNTNVVIPYIDLVNEILESAVAPANIPRPTMVDTQGTTAQRRALPQQTQPDVATAAYKATLSTIFPFPLPFDADFDRTSAYIAGLGTTRSALLSLFPPAASASVVACATLGVNPTLQAIINTEDAATPWVRWGLAQNPTSITDPKTGQAYSPTPADWVAALNKVPVLLKETSLTLHQLYQLLEVIWVTQKSVTLQAGTTTVAGQQILSANTDDMSFTGLNAAVLDRANRFLRLWTASGLQMWELDWALEQAAGGNLDDSFLEFLAGAITVQKQLQLPFQEVLTFWASLETRSVTSHLGDADIVVPAAYQEIFVTPTMLASWGSVFSDPPALSGARIVYPASASPNSTQLQPLNAINAALGLAASDISAILAASQTANSLTLDTLTALVRYARLAKALSLSVPNLILMIELTGGTPFGGKPGDTIECLRRIAVMQGTSIAPQDLDYLLRNQSAAASALAFTPTAAAAVLQSVRDAVAKAISGIQMTLTSIANTTPIAVTTAKPHGLATGTPVFVSGVKGTTAANGKFVITVTNPTIFTLNGSAGNAAWIGGGTATAGLDDAITAIIVTALTTATSVSADVVSLVLGKTGMLPLSAATISALLAQQTVDPTQFQPQIAAITQVAKAAALFTALSTNSTAFNFATASAGTFGWLDPSALPLTPVTASPYQAFEKLLNALKLQQRQAARTPKLFDVLGAWMQAGQLPADVPTAIGGPTILVAGATNASPIAISTTVPHGLQSGAQVEIDLVEGNTAANGTWTITVTSPTAFTLDGSQGNAAWTAGGVVVWLGAIALAPALNATIADVTGVAQALQAKTPSLTPASQSGTLADIAMLAAIAAALDVVSRYSIDGQTLVLLAAATASPDTSNAAMGAYQAQYSQTAWLGAVQPIEDTLRQSRRDALVAYLLGPGPAPGNSPGARFLTTDDVFNYYLIDPEMCPCGQTTRLLQPSLAIQQFVQQCYLNLVINASVDMTDSRWSEWSWRQQYRLWQANREVFLYPENYVLPELRTNASSFFTDLENDLKQSNCDANACETAYENYLRKLVGVARLVVAGQYNQVNADESSVLHVFARTPVAPYQWYYRTRSTLAPNASTALPPAAGSWSAWESLSLDIAADQVMPVIWDRRLYLVWPIFKQITAKQGDQSVPKSGGGKASPPDKFWSIQFATSELSAGQWQAKYTYDQKMYVNTEDQPSGFTFKVSQDAQFNLQIQLFYTGNITDGYAWYTALATIPLPGAAMSVVEVEILLPSQSSIDLTQEPTYSNITTTNLLYQGSLVIEPTPAYYGFDGQNLTYGSWTAQPASGVPLYVTSIGSKNASPANVELLGTINSPCIVAPQQEPIFDSADPFFVADDRRTYLVQPHYFTISSSPVELENLTYVKSWATLYQFETFYHPYAMTFLRELEIGGVPQLMSRNLQVSPQSVRGWPTTFSFESLYTPQKPVMTPYPGDMNAPDPGETALDFAAGSSGAFSLYNWEVFYHGPMFVASQLMQNAQYRDTMTWLEYIFKLTDNSGGDTPQRFWQMAPLNAMHAKDWANQQIDALLATLASDTQQGINDASTQNAILAWMNDPYDPHMVASTRISAYGKATVMKFLDNLIAWGDSLYALYTAENVSQAEQLYIMADMILGPTPNQIRLPSAEQPTATTYAALKNLDLFSNVLVNVENVIVAPEPPQSLVQGTSQGGSLPQFPGNAQTLLFCIPANAQLLAYWGKVAQRLYNIRHCLNLQGVPQPLPLYAPPINPLQLIAAKAGGASSFGGGATAPIYRFASYLQKAVELTNEVRSYGAQILAALEKQDAEHLSALRASQEVTLQNLILAVKTSQVVEAQDQITVLNNQLAATQVRASYYSSRPFMNEWEITAIALQGGALIANGIGLILDLTAGAAHLAPSVTGGAAGFGGSPLVTVTYGGENIADSATSWANVARGIGGLLGEAGGMAATMGTYTRRQDEWTMQTNLANAEITTINSQLTAANDRVTTAQNEVTVQNQQITNAQVISDFMTSKYTNEQLYNWMVTQLTTVYTQAYQLAFSLALQAQSAYQYELGRPLDEFIQFSYWDNQHKGLTAGDSLLFDLRRMESQFFANNVRELELTKHVSLALTQPLSLVTLLETGSCQIVLDESLFDSAQPGQYFRRLRSVAVTIACVAGPYSGVNATLSLNTSVIRTIPPSSGYQPYLWVNAASNTDPAISQASAVSSAPVIAISTGQNDSGLFDVNLRDERWLPFEGQGAVSTWTLMLDPRDNTFDLSTVTDVVVHLRYSARFGGDAESVRKALQPLSNRSILISARNTFGDAYYSFFNPADTTATQQTLTLPLSDSVFPYSNLGTPEVTDFTLFLVLAEPMTSAVSGALSGMAIAGTFGPTGGASPPAATLKTVPGTAPGGGSIATLSSGDLSIAAAAPGSYTLTIPQGSIPPTLQTTVSGQARLDSSKIADIIVVVGYKIG